MLRLQFESFKITITLSYCLDVGLATFWVWVHWGDHPRIQITLGVGAADLPYFLTGAGLTMALYHM